MHCYSPRFIWDGNSTTSLVVTCIICMSQILSERNVHSICLMCAVLRRRWPSFTQGRTCVTDAIICYFSSRRRRPSSLQKQDSVCQQYPPRVNEATIKAMNPAAPTWYNGAVLISGNGISRDNRTSLGTILHPNVDHILSSLRTK